MTDKTKIVAEEVLAESHLPDDIWTPTEGYNYGLDGYPDIEYGSGVMEGDLSPSETTPRINEGVLAGILSDVPSDEGEDFDPMGDVGEFLKEGSLPDLDWLEVDEQDASRLPVNPVDIGIPELEEAWGVDRQSDGPQLVPAVDMEKAAYEQSLQDPPLVPVTTRQQMQRVVGKALRRITAGVPLPRVIAEMQRNMGGDPDSLKPYMASIQDAQGLAGRVYIQADAYPGCANGTWTETIKKTAAGARYVVAGASCAGCVHHNCGSCGVFKKQVVASVPWKKALQHYRPELEAAGRKVATGNPKEALRAAFAQAPVGMAAVESPRPTHVTPSERITPAQAQQEFKAAKVERKVYDPSDAHSAKQLHSARLRVAHWAGQGLLDKKTASRLVAMGDSRDLLQAAMTRIVASRGAAAYSGLINDTRAPDMSEEEAWKRLGSVAPLPTVAMTREQVDKQISRWAHSGLLDAESIQRLSRSTAEPRDILRSAAILASSVKTGSYSGAVNNMHGAEVSREHAWSILREAEDFAAQATAAINAEVGRREFEGSRQGKFLRNVQAKVANIESIIGRGLRGAPLLRLLRRSFTAEEQVHATPLLKVLLEKTGALKEEVKEIQEYRGAGTQREAKITRDAAMGLLLEAANESNLKTQALVKTLEEREFKASRVGKHMDQVQAKVAQIEAAIQRGVVGRNLLNLIQKTIRPDDREMAIPMLDPILQRTGALKKVIQTVHDFSGVQNKVAQEEIPTAEAWRRLFLAADKMAEKESRIQESRDAKVASALEQKVASIEDAIARGARGQALRKIMARTFLKGEYQAARKLLVPILEKTGALQETQAPEYQGTRYEVAQVRKADVTPLPKEVKGVVRWAQQKMSEGTAGKQLDEILSMRFSPRVLSAAHVALQEARREHEGLAGHLYVDAAAYASEKGVGGCESGALQHRGNPLKAVLEMGRCASCALRNVGSDGQPRCQTYGKVLVARGDVSDVAQYQAEAIRMADAPDQEVTASLFHKGFDPAEFGLGGGEIDDISLESTPDTQSLGDVLFGGMHLS